MITNEQAGLVAGIVSAYVSNNPVPTASLPQLIKDVHGTIAGLANGGAAAEADRPKPAVPISRSIQHDHIVCLEDGKKLKMLKRYLRSNYNLTPEQYRTRWGLKVDYPMVAPAYAAQRSEFAKKIGLGRTSTKKVRK
jgi:predicted transcriptional regulator